MRRGTAWPCAGPLARPPQHADKQGLICLGRTQSGDSGGLRGAAALLEQQAGRMARNPCVEKLGKNQNTKVLCFTPWAGARRAQAVTGFLGEAAGASGPPSAGGSRASSSANLAGQGPAAAGSAAAAGPPAAAGQRAGQDNGSPINLVRALGASTPAFSCASVLRTVHKHGIICSFMPGLHVYGRVHPGEGQFADAACIGSARGLVLSSMGLKCANHCNHATNLGCLLLAAMQ